MEKLLILSGPTAVGKTELSLRLAKAVGGEIISADSMQVYKGMDIGTAKITKEEMQGVPHHLIDILDPKEDFNVVRFKTLAKEKVKEINARGMVPIVVGGTGFYIQALLYDIDFTDNDDDMSYRHELEEKAEKEGPGALHEMLKEIDPESAEAIHANNVKRVIRALEFYKKSNTTISSHNREQRENVSPYDYRYFALTDDRAKIYERIDRRVDIMLQNGLVDEVKRLLEAGVPEDSVSMQGLGYKEIVNYLQGRCSLEEAVYVIKRDTRHFAKRQLTWLRREKDVIWFDKSKETDDEILERMKGTLK
ncbi:MAG: tRNA (adenosine(37)-N6)-dimethylallyltransferase MiaA [Lachnospiraceae bacterium]|nr:tRNA (adenosine(37)-N6)-dimethylallyltransferase MiaA [Lachnospiraceae bacterium]